jgi:hypothetical protein
MKNKIFYLSGILAILILASCGKKASKNDQKDTVKKDSVKKTDEPKKDNNSTVSKLGIDIPKGTFTYYGRQKDGYMLLAVELDNQTFKRKTVYFKDVSDKNLQTCDILSDKQQGDDNLLVIKTKETQKEVKIQFPLMGDLTISGKKLVPATIFTSEQDKRILTMSGGPIFMPFLIGESFNDLEEIKVNYPEKGKHPKYGEVFVWFKGKNRGKNTEIIVLNTEKANKMVLVEEGKEIHFTQYE